MYSDDSVAERAAARKRQKDAAIREKQSKPAAASRARRPQTSVVDVVDYDRSWLQLTTAVPGLYTPQLGDVVVYVRQSHAEWLRAAPSTLQPPWQTDWPSAWYAVLCEVKQVGTAVTLYSFCDIRAVM